MLTKLEILKSRLHEKAKNNKAFTLIELIIVIVIIGILVAVAMANMGKNTDDSKIARAKADIRLVAGALDRYYADTGKTDFSAELNTDCQEKLAKQVEAINGEMVGPYLKTCPISPWEGSSYKVEWDNDSLTYNVYISFSQGSKTKYITSKNLTQVFDQKPE